MLADDGAAGDAFGFFVALCGDVAVAGAIQDDLSRGSAYVFRYDGSGWVQEAKLLADDGAMGDAFGGSVAVSGDIAVIGANGDDDNGDFCGSAYVFRYDPAAPGSWVQQAKVLPADGAAHNRFSLTHVAVSGDTAIVGAATHAHNGVASGSTYVFGGLGDCNGNGELDLCDIADGTSADGNGTPDECEPRLDIKPGSCPNPLNRRSHGVLSVALVGTLGFDVTQVDLASVLLVRADGVGGGAAPNEGPPGPHSTYADVATPFEGGTCDCHDWAGDGIDDLSMKFRTQALVEALQLNDLSGGESVELVITGSLLDGSAFTNSRDCILIVPPGNGESE